MTGRIHNADGDRGTVLAARHLSVAFGSLWAVRDVSFAVPRGGVLGVVGESGSGKTTVARAIAGFQPLTSGSVILRGRALAERRNAADRRAIQLMPQDPYSSLNPRLTVRQMLFELLRHVLRFSGAKINTRAERLLRLVQLNADALDAYPQQFSGGQRQRIALARALAVEPDVLILDEPTSALDTTVQLRIVNLLQHLRRQLGLTMVFISHDLGVVKALCDDILVLRDGTVEEHAASRQFFVHPTSPYSRLLLDSVPQLSADKAAGITSVSG